MTTGGHDANISPDHDKNGVHMPITLEDRVGLCVRSIIMPGVKIGHHSQISPGVVLSKSVKQFTTVASAVNRQINLDNI